MSKARSGIREGRGFDLTPCPSPLRREGRKTKSRTQRRKEEKKDAKTLKLLEQFIMDQLERKRITDENEGHVREWFEASGFASTKLDTRSGKKGKKADWRFTKPDLSVLCEVKTIFSGGQSGRTEDQRERRRLEAKRKFEYHKAHAIAEGVTLLTHKDEQDYLAGKTPYFKQPIVKEEEFNKFLSEISDQLKRDPTVKELPFDISISFNAMYVPYGNQRREFIDWLKNYVLWAHQNQHSEQEFTTSDFTFRPHRRTHDDKYEHSIEAFVQMWGPYSGPMLRVSFIYGGVPYNEKGISDEIDEAISQLRASMLEVTPTTVLPVIALWSESDYLHFPMLLAMDATGAKLGDVPERYYLFDWAFEEYPDLAVIVLFSIGSDGDFWNPSPEDKHFPVAYLIMNPHLPEAESALRTAGFKNCAIMTGIASDPLSDEKDK